MRELAERILGGDVRALARAATAVEDRSAGWQELLAELRPKAGRALVIGVTGPPGAGKSTLMDRLVSALRKQGKSVAVLAVDPTSPYSGGAILGDRIRMQSHTGDAGVFIRSLATRGAKGGLAAAVRDMVTLFDAAGRDAVLIETVGVGQSEVEVAREAAVTVVVLVPGMGDDVQAIKAGILEVADVFAINKADLPGAEKLAAELHEFDAPVVRTVATDGKGIGELLAAIEAAPRRSRAWAEESRARVDHLGIAVRSVEEALAFYRDRLGLKVSMRETVASENAHVATLPVGESRIELLEATSEDSVIARFVEKRGGGLHHLALRVQEFDRALERLRAAGAQLLNEPRIGTDGHKYVLVHPTSTGGVLLELIEEQERHS